jgi:hypothetical protein
LSAVLTGRVLSLVPDKPVTDFDLDASYARTILDGTNPYTTGVVPRPPSAWLLQLPLAWVDTRLLAWVAGVAAVVSVAWLAHRILGGAPMWLPVIALAVSATAGARLGVTAGNMALVIAPLVVYAWHRRAGWAIGVAGALRLYPMAFAVPMRRWSAWWVPAMLGIAGLILVPDLGLADMVENARLMLDHDGNGTIQRYVGLPATLAVGALILWRSTRVDFDQGMCLAACAAVLVPSVSWPAYGLVLVPAVAWAVSHGRLWGLAAVPWWYSGFGLLDLGTAHLVAALIVLSAVWHRESPPAEAEGRSELQTGVDQV